MPRQAVAAEWAKCRGFLLPALVDTTEAELLADLEANRAQLWRGDGAAVVTQLLKPPPLVHVWLAGGDLNGILAMRPGIEAWGRAQGCETITINGRAGWFRVLRANGYERDGGELRKAL